MRSVLRASDFSVKMQKGLSPVWRKPFCCQLTRLAYRDVDGHRLLDIISICSRKREGVRASGSSSVASTASATTASGESAQQAGKDQDAEQRSEVTPASRDAEEKQAGKGRSAGACPAPRIVGVVELPYSHDVCSGSCRDGDRSSRSHACSRGEGHGSAGDAASW